jgi:hypothetical protein
VSQLSHLRNGIIKLLLSQAYSRHVMGASTRDKKNLLTPLMFDKTFLSLGITNLFEPDNSFVVNSLIC